jgi:hypothetical protein
VSETSIEDVLDDLLRRTRADARTTRRLLEEASDHLYTTAAELEAAGLSRHEAEVEAARRFGPVRPIVQAVSRRSVLALGLETLRAALFLAGCGLVAVGASGLVALVMNVLAGRAFVGGRTVFWGAGADPSVREVADDAVVLRAIAGLVGLFLLLGYLTWRRHVHRPTLLSPGLVDALGAAAFAAGAAGLTIAAADQAAQTGTPGVGFPLSGALVALPASIYFCIRATRAVLRSRAHPYESVGVTEAGD